MLLQNLRDFWRPIAAIIYLSICIFDFVIMPVFIEISNDKLDPAAIIKISMEFKDKDIQLKFIDTFAEKRTWNPLTLLGGGMFHLSFGAIVGAAAFTRGLEKRELAKRV